ncbi:anoctamin-8 [Condylostylus longicornis]|uniref:anoctamin-8 n=1 Tax=Condylostylus longicornis TaxID=2530218 RepID=UPI00244DE657|nr:anoctamin-8 [Condylostylus longicornis]
MAIAREMTSRQLRRKVPYAGHLMTPRRLWLNKIPTQCDVVIEFPEQAPDEALRWLLARIRSQPPSGLGLAANVKSHESTKRTAFYISAPINTLYKAAEEARLPKRLRNDLGGALREFTTRECHCFEQIKNNDGSTTLFTSQERQWLVLQMLQGLRAGPTDLDALQGRASVEEGQSIVAAWQETGLILQVFPLHETSALTRLQMNWVKKIFAPQPLDDIAEYFGVKVALYFAWLGHYTCALGVPAVFGTILWAGLYGRGQTIKDMGHVLFSLFNVAWASLYLEAWRRYSVELAFRWGTLSTPPEMLEPPRPLFKGPLVENCVTGRLEPKDAPIWKQRAFRYFVSFPIIGVCLLIVFIVMFLMLRFQDWWDSKLPEGSIISCLSVIPKVLLAGAITLMDEAYYKLAVWLNDKENYRLQSKYENHLIAKVALFQFVNSFLSLFYIAFYIRDEEKLKEQLAGLLISRQIIGNLRESALPYMIEQWKLAKLSFKLGGALSPTQLISESNSGSGIGGSSSTIVSGRTFDTALKSATTTTSAAASTVAATLLNQRSSVGSKSSSEELLNIKKQQEQQQQQQQQEKLRSSHPSVNTNNGNDNGGGNIGGSSSGIGISEQQFHSKRNIGQAEIESTLNKYDGTFSDHLEMLVQMGYVVLFSAAFPLAGLCALANNLLEIRSDAFKLAHVHQRPFGQRVANIGTWQNALSVLSLAAVIVNCALIGLSGQVSRLWPGLTTAQTIMLIVALEHIMLGLRSALTWLLPELPSWLAAEIARAEHCRREMQVKGTSPRPTPPSPPSTTSVSQQMTPADLATTNDESMDSQIMDEDNPLYIQQQLDEIHAKLVQESLQAELHMNENIRDKESSPDSPPSQTSTILIRPLHESTPPNGSDSTQNLPYDVQGLPGACKNCRLRTKVQDIPPFRGSSVYSSYAKLHAFSGPSGSSMSLAKSQPMYIPEIPPFRQKKSQQQQDKRRDSENSITGESPRKPQQVPKIGEIASIPPFKARKSSESTPHTNLEIKDKNKLMPLHVPEWISRLKVNESTNIHRSIDCIASKEIASNSDSDVLKPAPSWTNVAGPSTSTTSSINLTKPSTPAAASASGSGGSVGSSNGGSGTSPSLWGARSSSITTTTANTNLTTTSTTTTAPTTTITSTGVSGEESTNQANVTNTGRQDSLTTPSTLNVSSKEREQKNSIPSSEEDAKDAAKKSLKQTFVKRARSVAIFSLKLKERRQREAEKAAQMAIEHAKASQKLPQPGGELSFLPLEQLIQIDDIIKQSPKSPPPGSSGGPSGSFSNY